MEWFIGEYESHPSENNDDLWTSTVFDNLERARAAFDAYTTARRYTALIVLFTEDTAKSTLWSYRVKVIDSKKNPTYRPDTPAETAANDAAMIAIVARECGGRF